MTFATSNLGDFLALNRTLITFSSPHKCLNFLTQSKPLTKNNKLHTTSNFDDQDGEECRITQLSDDVISMIMSYLNPTDFVRLLSTCKSLKRVSQRQFNYLRGPQQPWLLLPHSHMNIENNSLNLASQSLDSLTFYDIFEAKIRTLKLPNQVRGGWCCGPCRGSWVPMTNRLKHEPDVFLVNPISGQVVALPPISTIPGYDSYAQQALDPRNASCFIMKLDFSGPSPAEPDSVVAGLFFDDQTIAFCKVGQHSWTTAFELVDDDIKYNDIMFSSNNSNDGVGDGIALLYATSYPCYSINNSNNNVIQTKSLSIKFQDENDDDQVTTILFKYITPCFINKLQGKLEPERIRWAGNDAGYCVIENSNNNISYLLETSSKGKLLIVFKTINTMINHIIDNDHADDDEDEHEYHEDELIHIEDEPYFDYHKTTGFKVFGFDPNTGEEVSCVDDDDVIFVGSSCFSLSSRDFAKGFMPTNKIYFLEDFTYCQYMHDGPQMKPYASRETGVFDMHTKKIIKCFPSVLLPMHSQMLWFTPSF